MERIQVVEDKAEADGVTPLLSGMLWYQSSRCREYEDEIGEKSASIGYRKDLEDIGQV